jgi:hypothetical protein
VSDSRFRVKGSGFGAFEFRVYGLQFTVKHSGLSGFGSDSCV